MANVLVVLAVLLLAGSLLSLVNRRRNSFVPRRGTSIGADLGALSDQPRVRVREVTLTGPDRVHLILTPEPGETAELTTPSDLDIVVSLRDGLLDLLQQWQQSGSPLAIVIPPDSRLIRLRSVDDLQPVTLRRVE